MTILILFFIGLILGSFLGVLVDRIPQGKTILKGRSKCDYCNKELTWYELIPILSYVIQNGKCRNCGKRISLFYLTIELLTGLLFPITYLFLIFNSGFTILNLIFYLFIVSSLIIIFFTDLKYGIIPNKIVFPAILITLLWLAISHQPLVISHLISAIGGSIFLILISGVYYLIRKKESMGEGDIKFAFLIGLLLGFPNIIIAFYIAFLTGAGLSIILILWARLKLKDSIPFGPFLVFGTLSALYLGERILVLVSPWLSF